LREKSLKINKKRFRPTLSLSVSASFDVAVDQSQNSVATQIAPD
jgi:hypothetical protein